MNSDMESVITELRDLISQMRIIDQEEEHQVKKIEIDKNEIIYEYDTDEENEEREYPIKEEEGETSNKRKRRDFNYNIDEYMRQQGYSQKPDREWKRYNRKESAFTPKVLPSTDMLKLDCAKNKEQLILDWINRTGLTTELDGDIQKLTAIEYLRFLQYKTSGIVFEFFIEFMDNQQKNSFPIIEIARINIEQRKTDSTTLNRELLKLMTKELMQQFIGISDSTESANKILEEAKWKLNNIQLCDLCYFHEFVCQYEKYYYSLNSSDYDAYIELFINKIPYPVNVIIKEKYQAGIRENSTPKTLGGVIRIVDQYIAEQCLQQTMKKQTYSAVKCCNKYENIVPLTFGCRTERKQFKKNRQYKKFPKWKKRRFYKPWKQKYRNKYFQKKQTRKQKYCPKGKKTCKCWLCQEEGHYANNCPRKQQQSKEKVRMLELLSEYELEPIEDMNPEISEVYELLETSSEESSSDESDL
ncbi:uncharacterized protein LOC125370031 [Ricinus communis]|uniref:uncharacterized protein LOC125370031 n=1 Tax=Ricinus communis TaxID=3988 RepID=UPI00201A887C|nr:uncharacterized protein LOC125370031 [Ricinus communis]